MREELFQWIEQTFGEEEFLGVIEYNESTVNRMLRDSRIYRITEIKFVVGLPFKEVEKMVLEKWQNELAHIFQLKKLIDRFDIEVDHSKRLVTPGEVDAKLENKDMKFGSLIEKKSLLLRVNVFKKRPYKGD